MGTEDPPMKFQSLHNGGQQEPSPRSQEDMGPRGNQTTITPHGAPLVQTEALLCPEPQPTPSSYLMPQLKEKPRWKCQIRSAHISRLTWQTWTHVPHMQRTAPCIQPGLYFVRYNYRRRLDPAESCLSWRCYYGKWNGQQLYAARSRGRQPLPGCLSRGNIPNAEHFPVGWILIHVSTLPTSWY